MAEQKSETTPVPDASSGSPGQQLAQAGSNVKGIEHVLKEGDKTVTMIFPRRVVLMCPGFHRVEFPAGTQEVPESLADHQYLKDHGVKRYEPKVSKADAGDKGKSKGKDKEKSESADAGDKGKGGG